MVMTAPTSITLPLVHFEGSWTARERERISAAAKQFDGRHPSGPAPEEAGAQWVAVKTPASWGTLYAMHGLGTPATVTTARSLSALINRLQAPAV